jgi:ElaB/YqjD/DUF883 family membrane-anchored ribosome-binding protein
MKRRAILAVVLVSALAVVGCKDKYESAVVDSMDYMKDMVSVLEGVKDVQTAKDAKGKLEKLAEQAKAMQKKMKDMGDPPKDREKELKDKYNAEMEKITKKLGEEMIRIAKISPEVLAEVTAAMPK